MIRGQGACATPKKIRRPRRDGPRCIDVWRGHENAPQLSELWLCVCVSNGAQGKGYTKVERRPCSSDDDGEQKEGSPFSVLVEYIL